MSWFPCLATKTSLMCSHAQCHRDNLLNLPSPVFPAMLALAGPPMPQYSGAQSGPGLRLCIAGVCPALPASSEQDAPSRAQRPGAQASLSGEGLRPPPGSGEGAAGRPCCGRCGCTSCTPSSGLRQPPCTRTGLQYVHPRLLRCKDDPAQTCCSSAANAGWLLCL